MSIHTYTATSSFAPYLVNGDASGYTEQEIVKADEFVASIVAEIGSEHCVDAREIGFGQCPVTGLLCNLCEYDFLTDA